MSEETYYYLISMNEDLEVIVDHLSKKELTCRLRNIAEDAGQVPAIIDPAESGRGFEMNDLLEDNSDVVLVIKGGKIVCPSIESKTEYKATV